MKIEVDIDGVAAKEIGKRDKLIESLRKDNEKLQQEVNRFKERFARLEAVRATIVEAAYWIDPNYGYDD